MGSGLSVPSVPPSRTVNKKPLNQNITLDLEDFPNVKKSIADIENQIAEIPTELPVMPKPVETIIHNKSVLISNNTLAIDLTLYDELRVYTQLSANDIGSTLYCGVNTFLCRDLLADKIPDYHMCVCRQMDYVSFGYYGGNINVNANSRYWKFAGIYKIVGIKNVSN